MWQKVVEGFRRRNTTDNIFIKFDEVQFGFDRNLILYTFLERSFICDSEKIVVIEILKPYFGFPR